MEKVSCPKSVAGSDWNLCFQCQAQLMFLFVIPQHLFLSSATSVMYGGEVIPRVSRDLGLECEQRPFYSYPKDGWFLPLCSKRTNTANRSKVSPWHWLDKAPKMGEGILPHRVPGDQVQELHPLAWPHDTEG